MAPRKSRLALAGAALAGTALAACVLRQRVPVWRILLPLPGKEGPSEIMLTRPPLWYVLAEKTFTVLPPVPAPGWAWQIGVGRPDVHGSPTYSLGRALLCLSDAQDGTLTGPRYHDNERLLLPPEALRRMRRVHDTFFGSGGDTEAD